MSDDRNRAADKQAANVFVAALGAAIAVFRFKAGMIPTLAASCAAGVVPHALGLVTATPL